MHIKAYSIHDVCADAYGTPFFAMSDPVAARSFLALSDDPQSTLYQAPSDYTLYRIGYFDDSTGTIMSEPTPVFVVRASAKSTRVDPLDVVDDPRR